MKHFLTLTLISLCTSMSFAQLDRSQRPVAGAAPNINIKEPHHFTLDNGMQVLVIENHKLPKFQMQLTLEHPPYQLEHIETKKDILSEMLGVATESTPKEEFLETLDFHGADLSFRKSGVRLSGLSKYFDTLLGLMAEAVLTPRFLDDEFEKIIEFSEEGLKNYEKDGPSIASAVSSSILFGNSHPYGEIFSPADLKNVSKQDLVDLYHILYQPEKAYLIISGDVQLEKVKDQISTLFGKWKSQGTTLESAMRIQKKEEQSTLYLVDLPTAVQSSIKWFRSTDIKLGHPDYFKLTVANQIYGGDFSSYLNMNLREANAWTYGARNSHYNEMYLPSIRGSVSVRNSVTDSAIVETFKEMERMPNEAVASDALSRVKSAFSGNFIMNMENDATIARFAKNRMLYNLDSEYYPTYLQSISSVTADEILGLSKEVFQANKYDVLVVGNAREILDGLKKLNMPIVHLDIYGNTVETPNYNEAIPEGITVESILSAYREALGDAKTLESITSKTTVYTADMSGATLEVERSALAPHSFSTVVKFAGNEVQRSMFNGTKGYSIAQGQNTPMTDDEIKESQSQHMPFPNTQLPKGKLIGKEMVNGTPTWMIKTGNSSKYYSIESGLLLQDLSVEENENGASTIITQFTDYKPVKGIQVPHTIKSVQQGQELLLHLKSVDFNPRKLSAKDFQ